MATERWDDNKLDKLADQTKETGERIKEIAAIAENNSRLIESNSRAFAEQIKEIDRINENSSRLIESNARVIQALANTAAEAREERLQILQLIAQQQVTIAQQQERMVEIEERIDRQQTNIDGLRRETMRMLDLLLNQQNQQDNSEE
jgi:hypothetical protein